MRATESLLARARSAYTARSAEGGPQTAPLRAPITPADPDPGLARALRTRLERALLDPREDPVTTLEAPRTTARMRALTPYLAVTDAVVAVDFCVAAFGAVRHGAPILMPDGRTGHVEVALGDSVLMLADEFPEMGLAAPDCADDQGTRFLLLQR